MSKPWNEKHDDVSTWNYEIIIFFPLQNAVYVL